MTKHIFAGLKAMVFLLTAAFFTSCEVEDSINVNQDKIYTDYEVFYNSNTDKTWVIARFRFGGPTGTLLELNEPASVSFDGEDLPFNALFAGHYKEYAGQVTSGTFEYTDTDGMTFINALPTYEPVAFPASLDSVSKSSAYSLEWDGTALAADQWVGLFVGSWTWGDDALYVQNGDGATDIVLGTAQLADVPTGPSIFYMDRATDVPVTEGTSEGGRIKGKFRATNKTVQIVD